MFIVVKLAVVLAVAFVATLKLEYGLPETLAPLKVLMNANLKSVPVESTGAAIDEELALAQKIDSRAPAVPEPVDVSEIRVKPFAVARVLVDVLPADEVTNKSATSFARCEGHGTETAVVVVATGEPFA